MEVIWKAHTSDSQDIGKKVSQLNSIPIHVLVLLCNSLHECGGESSASLLEGMATPIDFHKGQDLDSFSVNLKRDSVNLSMLPSKSQIGTSSGSLSISSGRDLCFLSALRGSGV